MGCVGREAVCHWRSAVSETLHRFHEVTGKHKSESQGMGT